MRPAETSGEDQPFPGIFCFQAIFFVGLQWSGRCSALATPCPVGPRNSGQSCAVSSAGPKVAVATNMRSFSQLLIHYLFGSAFVVQKSALTSRRRKFSFL